MERGLKLKWWQLNGCSFCDFVKLFLRFLVDLVLFLEKVQGCRLKVGHAVRFAAVRRLFARVASAVARFASYTCTCGCVFKAFSLSLEKETDYAPEGFTLSHINIV